MSGINTQNYATHEREKPLKKDTWTWDKFFLNVRELWDMCICIVNRLVIFYNYIIEWSILTILTSCRKFLYIIYNIKFIYIYSYKFIEYKIIRIGISTC